MYGYIEIKVDADDQGNVREEYWKDKIKELGMEDYLVDGVIIVIDEKNYTVLTRFKVSKNEYAELMQNDVKFSEEMTDLEYEDLYEIDELGWFYESESPKRLPLFEKYQK